MRADSGFYTHAMVAVCRDKDVRFSITVRQHQSLRQLIEAIPEEDWTPIPYWMDGAADVAETTYTPFDTKPDAAPVRLIVRRVQPTPGSQLALFANYSYHAFITDREGDTWISRPTTAATLRSRMPFATSSPASGSTISPRGASPPILSMPKGAWLAVQSLPRTRYGVIAHNLARWTARIGLGEQLVTTKTLRRRFISLARRLTRSARRLTLHLPRRWPWENQFSRALARLRALPFPT